MPAPLSIAVGPGFRTKKGCPAPRASARIQPLLVLLPRERAQRPERECRPIADPPRLVATTGPCRGRYARSSQGCCGGVDGATGRLSLKRTRQRAPGLSRRKLASRSRHQFPPFLHRTSDRGDAPRPMRRRCETLPQGRPPILDLLVDNPCHPVKHGMHYSHLALTRGPGWGRVRLNGFG